MSLNSALPRTSITTASLGRVCGVRDTRSASVPSICGGRLSTTYHPRSSSALAAVERPAPDIPVTISNSAVGGFTGSRVEGVASGGGLLMWSRTA